MDLPNSMVGSPRVYGAWPLGCQAYSYGKYARQNMRTVSISEECMHVYNYALFSGISNMLYNILSKEKFENS